MTGTSLALASTLLALTAPLDPAPQAVAITLDEVVELALESSPALAAARARVAAAAARLDAARVDGRPTVDLIERWSRTDDPTLAFMSALEQGRLTPELQERLNDPPTTSDWRTSLEVRYLLTDFGGRSARRAAASEDARRHALLERVARRDVVYSIREAWQDAVAERANERTWTAALEVLETDERLTRARFDEGAALRSDVLSIGVRRQEAAENLLTARNSAVLAVARLERLVGHALPALELETTDRPAPPPPESEVVDAALSTHPQLAALAAAERAAEAAVDAARASRRPRVGAEASLILHGNSESLGLERDSYVLGLALHVPVHDAGRSRAATAEARARLDEVRAQRRDVVLALELAARTAARRLGEALSRIGLAKQAVESAAVAHSIVRERYGVGLAPVTELLETERRLTEARVREVQARAAAWKARAALERVAGRTEP